MSNSKLKIASVLSLGTVQSGQNHRSSGNFSTADVPSGYKNLSWEVSETANPSKVNFNVFRDVSAGIDTKEYSNVKNGSITEIKKIRNLYIGDPSTPSGGDFIVTVYAIKE